MIVSLVVTLVLVGVRRSTCRAHHWRLVMILQSYPSAGNAQHDQVCRKERGGENGQYSQPVVLAGHRPITIRRDRSRSHLSRKNSSRAAQWAHGSSVKYARSL